MNTELAVSPEKSLYNIKGSNRLKINIKSYPKS